MIWIHPGTYTYRFDAPDRLVEFLWVERSGWGYLRIEDKWVQVESDVPDLLDRGFTERCEPGSADTKFCPHCGMYISGIPGALVQEHVDHCGSGFEDERAQEEAMVTEKRRVFHEQRLLAEKQRQIEEAEEAERKERFDRIKEEQATRQQQKDRKKRMKEETREQLRKKI